MVFTEDLGNCSFAVRTTSASNAGPVDGFVRRAFNETPGDGIPSCRLRLCRLPSPSTSFLSVVSGILVLAAHMIHSYAGLSYAYTRALVHQWSPALSYTRDICVIFRGVLFPVLLSGIGIFRPSFPPPSPLFCTIFPDHFPVYRARCF